MPSVRQALLVLSSSSVGHEAVLTTFNSYGQVGSRRQGELIRNLGRLRPREQPNADDIVEGVLRKLGHSTGPEPS